jgi:hypothetical protein
VSDESHAESIELGYRFDVGLPDADPDETRTHPIRVVGRVGAR